MDKQECQKNIKSLLQYVRLLQDPETTSSLKDMIKKSFTKIMVKSVTYYIEKLDFYTKLTKENLGSLMIRSENLEIIRDDIF